MGVSHLAGIEEFTGDTFPNMKEFLGFYISIVIGSLYKVQFLVLGPLCCLNHLSCLAMLLLLFS